MQDRQDRSWRRFAAAGVALALLFGLCMPYSAMAGEEEAETTVEEAFGAGQEPETPEEVFEEAPQPEEQEPEPEEGSAEVPEETVQGEPVEQGEEPWAWEDEGPIEQEIEEQAQPETEQKEPVYTFYYDEQPESPEAVLAMLEAGREPRWQYPPEEALVPAGFVLEQREDGRGNTWWTLAIEPPREAAERPVRTATELREAFADSVDGDVITLEGPIDLGTLADGDSFDAPLRVPSGVTLTVRSGEGGPYTIWKLDEKRHFEIVEAQETTLIFEGVVLATENQPGGRTGHGGGIEVRDSSDVTITGAVIRGGYAVTGGGLLVRGSENVRIEEAAITQSSAEAGGGLAFIDTAGAVLVRATLSENLAQRGGGLYVEGGALLVEGETLIAKNRAEAQGVAAGGGIAVGVGGQLTLDGAVALQENAAASETAKGYGGGLYLAAGDTAVALMEGTSIEGSLADIGGAVYLNEGASLAAEGGVQGVVLARNTATVGGGAVCAYEGAALALNGRVDIVGNTAHTGGGLYLYDRACLTASAEVVFDENEAAEGYVLPEGDPLWETHRQSIAAGSFTGPFETAYNNHDINYTDGQPYVGEREPVRADPTPGRRQLREQRTNEEKGEGYGYEGSRHSGRRAEAEATGDEQADGMEAESAVQPTGSTAPPFEVMLLGAGHTAAQPVEEVDTAAQAEALALLLEPAEVRGWYMADLVLALVSFTTAALLLIGLFSQRKRPGEPEPPWCPSRVWQQDKMGFAWGVGGVVIGGIVMVVFLCSQDLAGPMGMWSGASPLLLCCFIVQCTAVALLRLNGQTEDSPGRYWSGSI